MPSLFPSPITLVVRKIFTQPVQDQTLPAALSTHDTGRAWSPSHTAFLTSFLCPDPHRHRSLTVFFSYGQPPHYINI